MRTATAAVEILGNEAAGVIWAIAAAVAATVGAVARRTVENEEGRAAFPEEIESAAL